MAAMTPSVATLTELPYELKLIIFTQLLSQEVVRLRTTCKALRDSIDDNAQQISKVICNRKLTQLKNFVGYYVTYEGDVDFLEALSRWVRLRGWAPSEHPFMTGTTNRASMDVFSKHWTPIKMYPDLSEQTQKTISGIAHFVWDISQDRNPAGSTGEDLYRYSFLQRMQGLRQDVPGFTDEECISMCNELRDTPGGRLSGPHRENTIIGGKIAFKDSLHAPGPEPSKLCRTVNPIAYERWITPKDAVEIFGVPRLPWTNQFTYCIESDWAHRTMNEITRLHTLNRPIPPLMFAAGMEELQIW